MKKTIQTITALLLWTCLISISSHTLASSESPHHSDYVGQETREIKSLSEDDIAQLQQGQGWGLAKAAELNGVPGPAHLLEMQHDIHLSPEQLEQITQLYENMKQQAIPLGLQLIQQERELNNAFAHGTITHQKLEEFLEAIARTQKQLRYVHLSTHLETPAILTPEQIDLYNKLRGYSEDVPVEHDSTKHTEHSHGK